MLGFAVLDRQQDSDATAVWQTCREDGVRVRHTNAVIIQHDDERYDAKLHALTANRAVVVTFGTTPADEFAHAIEVGDFQLLADETIEHQQRISAAVTDYAARSKNRNLVMPTYPPRPDDRKLDHSEQPQMRALAAANYVADVWSAWLLTEEQRARRTVEPRTGKGPWIMPSELGEPTVAAFPPVFERRFLRGLSR